MVDELAMTLNRFNLKKKSIVKIFYQINEFESS